jgi:hypothetical protein
VGRRDVPGPVADLDLAAQLAEPPGRVRLAEVRTRDLVAEVQQHFRDAAHADAADAYEVDVFNLFEHVLWLFRFKVEMTLLPCTNKVQHVLNKKLFSRKDAKAQRKNKYHKNNLM